MAEEKEIEIFGSYNPQTLGCVEGYFMDGMHMKRKFVGKSWSARKNIEQNLDEKRLYLENFIAAGDSIQRYPMSSPVFYYMGNIGRKEKYK